jgi:HK97 family phage major capsid protein
MSKIYALREERGTLAKEVRNLLDKHPGKEWGPDQQKVYDAHLERIEALDGAIQREQKAIDLLAAEGQQVERIAEARGVSLGDAKSIANRQREIHVKWLRKGDEGLSAEDRTFIRNTMSTTTGSEGGHTVPTTVANSVVLALKAYGGMRDVADVFSTDSGETINYPTSDGTAEVGELIAQNTTATAADPSFGVVSLPVYKYSSKIVAVPFELLQDSNVDIEALVVGRLGERLGRITNAHFTTGTGSGQPNGIVTAAASGKVGTTGQTLTVIYNDLIDLQHSVDPAYRRLPGVGFMMNDASVKVIRKIVDGQSRPIFVPGYETGSPGGAPDTLLG